MSGAVQRKSGFSNAGSRKAAIFIICISAVTVWWVLTPHEPAYQGKLLSSWLRDFDYSSERGVAARAAVRPIGTNALPTLIHYLNHRDGRFKMWLIAFLQKYGISARV